jgi:hypothetical protein
LCRHRLQLEIVSDYGKEFWNEIGNTLLKLMEKLSIIHNQAKVCITKLLLLTWKPKCLIQLWIANNTLLLW